MDRGARTECSGGLLGAGGALLPATVAYANEEIRIDTTADDADLPGGCVAGQQCSLRNAIRLANARPGRDAIEVGGWRFGSEHRCFTDNAVVTDRSYCEVRLTRPLPGITSPVDLIGGDEWHFLAINGSALASGAPGSDPAPAAAR